MVSNDLQTHLHISSEKGLSSVSTLIVGSKAAALIDPPFLVPDAKSVVEFIKQKTSLPLKAVFVTHHHPDHYCENAAAGSKPTRPLSVPSLCESNPRGFSWSNVICCTLWRVHCRCLDIVMNTLM